MIMFPAKEPKNTTTTTLAPWTRYRLAALSGAKVQYEPHLNIDWTDRRFAKIWTDVVQIQFTAHYIISDIFSFKVSVDNSRGTPEE
jgi:hypothetical protein